MRLRTSNSAEATSSDEGSSAPAHAYVRVIGRGTGCGSRGSEVQTADRLLRAWATNAPEPFRFVSAGDVYLAHTSQGWRPPGRRPGATGGKQHTGFRSGGMDGIKRNSGDTPRHDCGGPGSAWIEQDVAMQPSPVYLSLQLHRLRARLTQSARIYPWERHFPVCVAGGRS